MGHHHISFSVVSLQTPIKNDLLVINLPCWLPCPTSASPSPLPSPHPHDSLTITTAVNTTHLTFLTRFPILEQLQPSRLDFRSASKCLKQPPKPPPRLRVLEVTRRRRTPTLPSAASLHTCSLPMSNVRMSVRKTQASASVKSAKSLVIGGRLLVRSSVSHTRRRLPPTRSVTKTRRPSTMPLPVMRMRTKQVIVSGRWPISVIFLYSGYVFTRNERMGGRGSGVCSVDRNHGLSRTMHGNSIEHELQLNGLIIIIVPTELSCMSR